MTKTGHRVKVNVSLTPELLEKLDTYCAAIGVTRSAFVQTTLGQTLYGLGVLQESMERTVNDTLATAAEKMAATES